MLSVAGTGRICSQLSSGDGAAILVADFKALNGEPRLSELISEAAAGQRVYQVDPRGEVSGDRLYASLPELAEEAAAIFRSCEPGAPTDQRVFVVSHCSAVALSLRIASRLADAREVTAILVHPTWPGTQNIVERFAQFQGKLRADIRPCPDLDGDPWSRVAEMEQVMRDGLAGLATRLGLADMPPSFTDLLVSYRTWLSYLLACRNDLPAQAPSPAVVVSVLTPEPDFVLPGTGPGRCRIAPPPSLEDPDAVTPELVEIVLDQVMSR